MTKVSGCTDVEELTSARQSMRAWAGVSRCGATGGIDGAIGGTTGVIAGGAPMVSRNGIVNGGTYGADDGGV